MRPVHRMRSILFAAALCLAAQAAVRAQSLPVASRAAEISVFGGFNHTSPDYGENSANGITAGANYTRYLRLPVAPSLEVRGNYVNNAVLTEKSILFGLRAEGRFRRHAYPYADFLYGGGSIHFANPPIAAASGDRGSVFSYGGGVDYDIVHHIQAKVDFQVQHYNFGPNKVYAPADPNFTLSPYALTVGVTYRIPFKGRYGSGPRE